SLCIPLSERRVSSKQLSLRRLEYQLFAGSSFLSSLSPQRTVRRKVRSQMRAGGVMEQIGSIKVLFIAGFGPITREPIASRKLYSQILGIRFKEEDGGYLHTEGLKGANTFALWPLSQAAQSCFGTDSWPDEIPPPQSWLEFDVDSVEEATAELESKG